MLDDRNINDQGIDAAGNMVTGGWAYEVTAKALTDTTTTATAAALVAAINAIAKSSASRNDPKKMPDFSAAQPLYKYIDDPRVKEVIEKHIKGGKTGRAPAVCRRLGRYPQHRVGASRRALRRRRAGARHT